MLSEFCLNLDMITFLFNLSQDQSNQQVFIDYPLQYMCLAQESKLKKKNRPCSCIRVSTENEWIKAYDLSSLSTSI